jgi:hypothetical protein
MADIWNPTTPQTLTASNFNEAFWNQEVRDRFESTRACIMGDASNDADMKQAIKQGTLAARPAASLIGRQYFATDIRTTFADDSVNWRHAGGPGGYDSFQRGNNTALGNADSGHAWTEGAGDLEILTNNLHAVSAGHATIDSGGIIESARYVILMKTHTTAASIDFGVILRYTDASNYLYAQLNNTSWRLIKRVATVDTVLTTTAVTVTANTAHLIWIDLIGPTVTANIAVVGAGAANNLFAWDNPADITTPFATATKCGVRLQSSGAGSDVCQSFGVRF